MFLIRLLLPITFAEDVSDSRILPVNHGLWSKLECVSSLQVGHTKSRTWLAKEEYVSFEEFHGIASSGAYSKLIDCDEWKVRE